MQESQTTAIQKKRSGLLWQISQAFVAALVLGLGGWVLHTVESLQVKVATIESANRENMAQWQALSDLSEKVKNNEIEVIVNNRLMKILLDKDSIQERRVNRKVIPEVRVPKMIKPKDSEVIEEFQEAVKKIPVPTRKDRVDAFRDDQLRSFQQQQVQQSMMK